MEAQCIGPQGPRGAPGQILVRLPAMWAGNFFSKISDIRQFAERPGGIATDERRHIRDFSGKIASPAAPPPISLAGTNFALYSDW